MAKKCAFCGQGVMAGRGPIVTGYLGLQNGGGLIPVKEKGDKDWEPISHHDECFQNAARDQALQFARLSDLVDAVKGAQA